MIDQITVFLENAKGRLHALTRTISDAGVDMLALTISETSEYGLARIICDDPDKALEALAAADFRAVTTKVSAVSIPNKPGALADLLKVLDEQGMDIEYGYCFSFKGEAAVDVFKVEDPEGAAVKLQAAGFDVVRTEDLA